jgi:hypothetical protein
MASIGFYSRAFRYYADETQQLVSFNIQLSERLSRFATAGASRNTGSPAGLTAGPDAKPSTRLSVDQIRFATTQTSARITFQHFNGR